MRGARWLAFLVLWVALGVLAHPSQAGAAGVPVDQATEE